MKSYFAIGLMSGTSLDGVDLVYVKFDVSNRYSYKILYYETVNYSNLWKEKLQQAFNFNTKQLKVIDKEYGVFLGEIIHQFVVKNKIEKLDFIASHGHTIHHKPELGYTLQIGSGKMINERTKIKTICDFRSQDVAFGGQGAPLVPIGDALLFDRYNYCLNLGGFANISFDNSGTRIAFDICPVNVVLNHFAHKMGVAYDDKGLLAKSGKVSKELLSDLNKWEFYSTKPPKSLGIEDVLKDIFPIISQYSLADTDILRTFVEHIAMQIAFVVTPEKSLFITGGGAFNDFLLERITFHTKAKMLIPDRTTIDFKEALIFAFLGLRKLENKVNCLKSVTGAKLDHSSGVVFDDY